MHTLSPTEAGLRLVTCSMRGDLEIFAELARSVDECVAPEIRHTVIVPTADLPAFTPFATPQREIVAQETFLPWRLTKLPSALKHLSGLIPSLRRPIYLAPGFRPVRGWIIQQLLKIEVTLRAQEAAIMHVDSDVMFYRALAAHQAIIDGKPCFFSVSGIPRNDTSIAWTRNSAALLGIDPPDGFDKIYVENCILWSPAVVRRMVDRIEETHAKRYYDALIGTDTMSEYHIYGMYLDLIEGTEAVTPIDQSFCNSLWPGDAPAEYLDLLAGKADPRHHAIAIQSTEPMTAQDRRALLEQARTRLPA